MELKQLITNNYTRLAITGIKLLNYTPKNPMQIILASNGAGKSSLLKEIIPNVEELNKDYEEDGYRIATYNHNNKEYILSYIRNTNKHSFKVDGTELNTSGLKKTQQSLIEEHFNINKYIHELLLSTTSFTTMSIAERKRWFTEIITTIDYKYALDKYNKIKQTIRDTKSYIKLTQSKLLRDEEHFKNLPDDYIKQLDNDRTRLLETVNYLLDIKQHVPIISKPDTYTLLSDNLKLKSIIDKLDNTTNKDTLLKSIYTLENDITTLRKKKQDIENKLSKIDSELVIDTSYNTKEIQDEIDTILTKVNKYHYINPSNKLDDLLITVTIFKDNYTELSDIVISLSELEDIPDNNKEIANKLTVLNNDILNIEKDISTIEKEYNLQLEYSKQDDVTCPSCNYSFKPNFDKDTLNTIIDKLNNLRNRLGKLQDEHRKLSKLYDKATTKSNLLLRYDNLLLKSKAIYNYFKSTKYYKTHDELFHFYNELPDISTIESYRDRLNDLTNSLALYKNINISNMERLKIEKDKLIDDLHTTIDTIKEFISKLNNYKKQLNLLEDAIKYRDSIKHSLKTHFKYDRSNERRLLNDFINSTIKVLKEEIYDIEQNINNYNNHKEHYRKLEVELYDYKNELEKLLKLEELLSPSKGIIGKTITETINIVLEKMNYIINQVWEYEVEILPCDVSESDLTFRFPVKINNVKTIPDIIKGSASIREIIDLAFKITAMELLDMLEYPLILDEFSKTMDISHRIKSYNYIEKLSKEYFSQVFMVSHYEEMFLRFADTTDVVVLNNDNIKYTGKHNEVLEIKK